MTQLKSKGDTIPMPSKKILSDSAAMRWLALALLAFAMFCSYIFMDILSPIKDLLQSQAGWDSDAFGTMQGSETFLNVFIFFLIFAGVILDKMGVRFTAVLSGVVMLVGAVINWYALTDMFAGSSLEVWFTNHLNYIPVFDELGVSPFYEGMPASAKFSAIGFMIFGCGVEMAGITVSRGIVKWFKGREMAMAMGTEMALARLGVGTCMIFSPFFATQVGDSISVSRPVAFAVILLLIALMMFIVYFFMDKKLDSQTHAQEEKDDPFRMSDLGKIFRSRGFWIVALLCVLYYSAIFPFQKYAVNMLQCNLTLEKPQDGFWASEAVTLIQYGIMLAVAAAAFAGNFSKNKGLRIGLFCLAGILLVTYCVFGYMRQEAAAIFAVFPLLAVGITPVLGHYVDHKGKAATMLIFGSLLLIACHLVFAFVLPACKGNDLLGVIVAYATILVLGASFSLVPASLWPSVPKLVDSKIIGSAYALIFWIQNIGLWLFPILIGKVLTGSNPGIARAVADGTMTEEVASVSYNYQAPLVMLAVLGVLALILGLVLKIIDRKEHIGLEEPNIKPSDTALEAEVVAAEE